MCTLVPLKAETFLELFPRPFGGLLRPGVGSDINVFVSTYVTEVFVILSLPL